MPKIPILLLQGVDVFNLYDQTSCFGNRAECEIGIATSNETIPTELMEKVSCQTSIKVIPGQPIKENMNPILLMLTGFFSIFQVQMCWKKMGK